MRAPLVVLLRLDGLRNDGVSSIGADHGSCPLGHCGPSAVVTADPCHRPIGGEDLVDGEPLAQLRTGLDGRFDQHLIENRAARTVPMSDPIDWQRGP
jgi:hypothetical protein